MRFYLVFISIKTKLSLIYYTITSDSNSVFNVNDTPILCEFQFWPLTHIYKYRYIHMIHQVCLGYTLILLLLFSSLVSTVMILISWCLYQCHCVCRPLNSMLLKCIIFYFSTQKWRHEHCTLCLFVLRYLVWFFLCKLLSKRVRVQNMN